MEMTTEAMQDPFSRFSQDFSEMYEIVRTVMVGRHRRLYKIEVLKDHTAPSVFKVHYSLEERFVINPVDSMISEEFNKVWVDLTLPWVESDSADSALKEALFRLAQTPT
jgi:hypothetical protein